MDSLTDAPMPIETVPELPLIFYGVTLAIGDMCYYFPFALGEPPHETAQQETIAQSVESDTQPSRTNETESDGTPEPIRDASPEQSDATESDGTPTDTTGEAADAESGITEAEETSVEEARPKEPESEVADTEIQLVYDDKRDIWQPHNTQQQVEQYRRAGVKYLKWNTGKADTDICETCIGNHGQVRKVGEAYSSGHLLPQVHPHCSCSVEPCTAKGNALRKAKSNGER